MALQVPKSLGDFPELIDSTMRASWAACPTNFYWAWIRRLIPGQVSVDLHAGGAFAAGLEATRKAYYQYNTHPDDALHEGLVALSKYWGDFEAPEGHAKQFHVILGALEDYFREYPLQTDMIQPYRNPEGDPAVEFTFSIPIPGTKHPKTGNPILYGGRFDLIGVFNNVIYVVDEKTTGQLGASFAKKWDLRGQFLGYVWATRVLGGLPVAGAIVRGVGLYKTEPAYRYMQVVVPVDDFLIERWLMDLRLDVERMISSWEHGLYQQNFSDSCIAYSGCANKILCKSKEPERFVNNYFVRNTWNPLAKNPEEES